MLSLPSVIDYLILHHLEEDEVDCDKLQGQGFIIRSNVELVETANAVIPGGGNKAHIHT